MQWKKMALPESEDIIIELGSRKSGLSQAEVRERLNEYGPNRLTEEVSPWPAMLKRRFRSSFLYLLLAAALLSFILGERLEAALILVFVFINVALESYQEYHSEQSIRLLRRYLVSHVRVRRGGEVLLVENESVVPGDIVLVEAGDRLAADIRFISSTALMLDESVMSGESVPVAKTHAPLIFPKAEQSEAANIGFAGTVVTSGRGEGIVIATGKETSLGDIATMTEEPRHETTFEKGINHFSRFILRLVAGTLFFIFIANIFLRRGETNVAELLIFSLALAVSVIPEALPVITTVTLSRGSIRLAQKKVVVKRLSAIEDLGSISVLCTDKTGTLTENALAVADVQAVDRAACLRMASIASVQTPINRALLHDPFDLAIWHALSEAEKISVAGVARIDSLPFDPGRRRNSVLVQLERKTTLIVRGAFEEIIGRCADLSDSDRSRLIGWGNAAGKEGKRVLAVATRLLPRKRVINATAEDALTYVGMVAFLDPLKKSATKTISDARALGISVKILTGDSLDVAAAVAKSVGLVNDVAEEVITGAELEALSAALQREQVERCHVFARVSPQQKHLIISLLQEKHEVGFLGEGINDAPALKLANVGLVVQGAADIAKEAADIVLLQRNLGTVIEGVREGRIIFANILKYLRITLTSNFGNFYSVALASLFLPFVPLLPIQILLLNLLSDFPMIAVATDNVDQEELGNPRSYQVGSVVLMTIFFGFVSSLFDFALFAMFYREGAPALQTAWFMLSLVTEIILIFSLRTKSFFLAARRPSWALIGLSFLALVAAFGVVETRVGREVLHFSPESGHIIMVVMMLAGLYFVATEGVKRYYVRHFEAARGKAI
ncbi:MAG: HAD-IC family P-type ATPase [Candidatus Moraniibacteriota bacterium]|nr:MAG: HAD-IC family P-type ATPase [Candidatus Moranbacteria bacterium]